MTEQSESSADTVYLIDVDNTLLDNDRVIADLRRHLIEAFGADSAQRYWTALEALRDELGYVDYLGALQRLRQDESQLAVRDSRLLLMAGFLIDYPFADRLYPGALDALRFLRARGPTVIVSDGDVVFQPRKVQRSGLWDAVDGRVLIYVHKEQMLDRIAQAWPARRYVMIDDKLRILTAMKAVWGERLTTVFVRQGHYALDAALVASLPAADIVIDRIGDLPKAHLP